MAQKSLCSKLCCCFGPRTTKTARLAFFGVIAVVFVALACSIAAILSAILKAGLEAKFIVTSSDSSSYSSWVQFFADPADNPTYTSYYLFNMTNYNDVITAGAKPNYTEVGPYVYQFTRTRQNVEFLGDGGSVKFGMNISYFFDESKSCGNAYTDVIYNMNPAYMGAVATAGEEPKLQFGIGIAFIGTFIDFFKTTLVDGLTSESVPATLGPKYNTLEEKVGAAAFAKAWADQKSSAAPGGATEWAGMCIADVTGSASNIPAATVAKLFSTSTANSLLDSSWTATQLWLNATTDATSSAELQAAFSLSATQVADICRWRAAFTTLNKLQPAMLKSLGFSSTTELAVYQWVNVTATKGVSCQTLYPGQFASKPEIGATFPDALSYATGQKLLLGPYGLLLSAANKVLFGQILMSSSTKPSPLLEKYWGINPTTQAPDLNTYIFMLVGTFADPFLLQINADVEGLAAGRTVNGWLFTAEDKTLGLLAPDLAWHGHFFLNDSSREVIANPSQVVEYTAYTGKGDASKLNWVYQRNGNSFLTPPIWQEPERIEGTLASQFAFGVERGSDLTIWEEDLSRHLTLTPPVHLPPTIDYHGIELYTYIVDPKSMQRSAKFDQGNLTGFWNLTAAKNGAPVMVSDPHFYNTNTSRWLNQVTGVTPPIPKQHQTVLGVEPVTGSTMQANKRSQVNLYIPTNNPWFPGPCASCHPKVTTGVMYPLVWFDEAGNAGSSDVSQYKGEIAVLITLKKVLPWVFAALALLTVVAAALLVTVYWNKQCCCCRVPDDSTTPESKPLLDNASDNVKVQV